MSISNLGEYKRTHSCGALRKENEGQKVTLIGWMARRRDLGSLIFVNLRDRWGLTQLVFNPDIDSESHQLAKTLRSEFVFVAEGTVKLRDADAINTKMDTGEVEVWVTGMAILNVSETPPFAIEDDLKGVGDELRLKYRYLDLRRPALQKNFILRHKIALGVRQHLDKMDFLELETPILTKSTPEGARDYLVPSRVHRGKFYALPQSPQIFKQLFMVSGFERYFQITRCFRDEDLRADRQPEFTQIDLEMSFVQMDDIFAVIEPVMAGIMKLIDVEVPASFPRMSYDQALDRFGSDKPDIRFEMELQDFSEKVKTCGFKVFSSCVEEGGRVKGLCAPGADNFSRKNIEALESWLKQDYGIKGLAWLKWTDQGINGPIFKFLGEELAQELFQQAGAKQGDILFFVADTRDRANQALGACRSRLGKELGLIREDEFAFLWIVNFPLLDYDAEANRYVALHHPFTSPLDEDLDKMTTNPGEVRAKAYDLVLNGYEIGGGSIRIHRRDIQNQMFKALGLSTEEANEKFGFLLDALSFGAPPHGGIALGLDRISMLLAGEDSLRDVIAFPKTTSAICTMTESPSHVSAVQLKELGLALGSGQ